MKAMTRKDFERWFDGRITLARKRQTKSTVARRVHWFANRVNRAIETGDADGALTLALQFFEQFKRGWDSGDGTFFRELANCVETNARTLTERQLWLRRRLFRDETDPDKQTEFLEGPKLIDEISNARQPVKAFVDLDNPGFAYDLTQLGRDMARIGAVTKNSPARRRSPATH